MINLANSLVESYMYADMYNREYEGGSSVQEKVNGAGVPVEYILPSLRLFSFNPPSAPSGQGGFLSENATSLCALSMRKGIKNENENENENKEHQEGGQKHKGPFTNKVVPVGLVFIQTQKDPDVEYDDHFYPGINREVVPDALYEILMGSIVKSSKEEPARKKRITPTKKSVVKERSRKKR